MTEKDKRTKTVTTKPQKVLLHMARKDNDWAGKATCFSGGEEYVFDNLEDLFAWLRRPHGKSHHTPAIKLNDGDKKLLKHK